MSNTHFGLHAPFRSLFNRFVFSKRVCWMSWSMHCSYGGRMKSLELLSFIRTGRKKTNQKTKIHPVTFTVIMIFYIITAQKLQQNNSTKEYRGSSPRGSINDPEKPLFNPKLTQKYHALLTMDDKMVEKIYHCINFSKLSRQHPH